MNRVKSYDYIIAGAGCAGLSLAWFMLQGGLKHKKILIADKSLQPRNDKTWCFWKHDDLPFPGLIDYEWKELEIRTRKFHQVTGIEPFGYYCVRSDTYHENLISIMRGHPAIDWLESGIKHISTGSGRALMQTADGDFEAEYIFQSIIPINIDAHQLNVKQQFVGWEIRTEAPVFNAGTACFMDLSVRQLNGVTFMYILPFSSTEALLEHTLFSSDQRDPASSENEIRAYLAGRLNLSDDAYTIIRKERGIIPMVDNGFNPGDGGRVLNIGGAAGLAKASTGYTFTRTHRANRQIVEKLVNGDYPEAVNPSGRRFRAYDILLLYVIRQHPEKALEIFETLFEKNRLNTILKFLSEETGVAEELKIFRAMPQRTFFNAIFRTRKLLAKIAYGQQPWHRSRVTL